MTFRSFPVICAGLVVLTSSLAFAADVPETLTMHDLVGHPERWPATVTMTENVRDKQGHTAMKGQTVAVVAANEKGIFVDTGRGGVLGTFEKQSDVIDRANEKWAKLTPEQRALDAAAVMADASLWPDTIKPRRPVKIIGPMGLTKTVPAGSPLTLAWFDEQGVYCLPVGIEQHVNLKFEGTDMIGVAREKIGVEKSQRPSRLLNGVRDVMVDADGKKFSQPGLDDTKVFIFYYGAQWCTWCHKFSPDLVKWVNENGSKNPHLTVIMLDGDEKDADMFAYMKEGKMPWPAIRMADWKKVPAFVAMQRESWPQLLITDRWGKVIYNEVGGGPKDIALHTEALKKLAEGGAGK